MVGRRASASKTKYWLSLLFAEHRGPKGRRLPIDFPSCRSYNQSSNEQPGILI